MVICAGVIKEDEGREIGVKMVLDMDLERFVDPEAAAVVVAVVVVVVVVNDADEEAVAALASGEVNEYWCCR
jgi:hypothetical protein